MQVEFRCPVCQKEIPEDRKVCSYSCNAKKNSTIHGFNKTRLHVIWNGMKNRCVKGASECCDEYGHRGITVCPEWISDFMAFREWALANGYKDGLQIDRKEPDGNYEPGNCRWLTPAQNIHNTRSHKGSSSKYKGVHFEKFTGRWRACIRMGDQNLKLGRFRSEEDAARAYDAKAKEMWGEYARLNFPEVIQAVI